MKTTEVQLNCRLILSALAHESLLLTSNVCILSPIISYACFVRLRSNFIIFHIGKTTVYAAL